MLPFCVWRRWADFNHLAPRLLVFLLAFASMGCGSGRASPEVGWLNPIRTPYRVSSPAARPILTQTVRPIPLPITTIAPTAAATTTPAVATAAPTTAPTAAPMEDLVIGWSAGGLPLEAVRFGSGETALMIVAGIHGGYEENTVRLADQLILYLRDNPDLVPEGKRVYILRVLNPDGLARAANKNGRANQNGVDLNRNWDAFWQADLAQGGGCWSLLTLSAGAEAMSEPETRVLADFLLKERIRALISYHSAGQKIYAGGEPSGPPAVSEQAPSPSRSLAVQLARVSPYAYPPTQTCTYTGQLIDWAAQQGIAAVDVELSNHADTDLQINLKLLQAFLNWPDKSQP